MSEKKKTYICIDLKSFYASVECVERGLDALKTNLVVADEQRTDKTICLAVSPSLKLYGLPGRCRLYEVKQKVKDINYKRSFKAYNREFTGSSYDFDKLQSDSNLALDFIVAVPRMQFYMDYSARIYNIYKKYISPDDICVYSIDEVFIDATPYLNIYGLTGEELCMKLINDVYDSTGITATGGVGTNMYLAKIAMDIVAKKMPANQNGVRIACLDEMTYRQQLWDHTPLTDFWRIGKGIQNRLHKYGINTMGELARYSLQHEETLYKEFGINAELIIDHAWGWEPSTMEYVKQYRPDHNSKSMGQVLSEPYSFNDARIIIKEMSESLALDLLNKHVVTDSIGLYLGYDSSNSDTYNGEIINDFYGKPVPKPTHSSVRLLPPTNSVKVIMEEMDKLYNKIVNKDLTIRRVNIVAGNIIHENVADKQKYYDQMDLFNQEVLTPVEDKQLLEREKMANNAILEIRKKYGKNSVVKGMNLQKKATGIERNKQSGGHRL